MAINLMYTITVCVSPTFYSWLKPVLLYGSMAFLSYIITTCLMMYCTVIYFELFGDLA